MSVLEYFSVPSMHTRAQVRTARISHLAPLQAVVLTLGRLCCILEEAQAGAASWDEELARLAVPLLVDSLSGEAVGSAPHVHACGTYALSSLGVLYGNGHCRWAHQHDECTPSAGYQLLSICDSALTVCTAEHFFDEVAIRLQFFFHGF